MYTFTSSFVQSLLACDDHVKNYKNFFLNSKINQEQIEMFIDIFVAVLLIIEHKGKKQRAVDFEEIGPSLALSWKFAASGRMMPVSGARLQKSYRFHCLENELTRLEQKTFKLDWIIWIFVFQKSNKVITTMVRFKQKLG